MTEIKRNTSYDRFLSEHFLKEIKNKVFRLELISIIYKSYEKRNALKLSQTEWAKLQGLSKMTVRRIEKGQCYDTRLIAKYIL